MILAALEFEIVEKKGLISLTSEANFSGLLHKTFLTSQTHISWPAPGLNFP